MTEVKGLASGALVMVALFAALYVPALLVNAAVCWAVAR